MRLQFSLGLMPSWYVRSHLSALFNGKRHISPPVAAVCLPVCLPACLLACLLLQLRFEIVRRFNLRLECAIRDVVGNRLQLGGFVRRLQHLVFPEVVDPVLNAGLSGTRSSGRLFSGSTLNVELSNMRCGSSAATCCRAEGELCRALSHSLLFILWRLAFSPLCCIRAMASAESPPASADQSCCIFAQVWSSRVALSCDSFGGVLTRRMSWHVQAFRKLHRRDPVFLRRSTDGQRTVFKVSYAGESGQDEGGLFRDATTQVGVGCRE